MEKFHICLMWNVPKNSNFRLLKSSKLQFLGLQNDQNWFHVKIWVAEKSWNSHILHFHSGCPGLYRLPNLIWYKGENVLNQNEMYFHVNFEKPQWKCSDSLKFWQKDFIEKSGFLTLLDWTYYSVNWSGCKAY